MLWAYCRIERWSGQRPLMCTVEPERGRESRLHREAAANPRNAAAWAGAICQPQSQSQSQIYLYSTFHVQNNSKCFT